MADFFEFREKMMTRPRPVRPREAGPGVSQGQNALTVTQLTGQIERVIRSGFADSILVRGEVSNISFHVASGHLYFTMKDAENCVDCVMWKSDAARMKFKPLDGMELLASARVGVYGKRGRYQLYVTALRPMGQGALELAFQQMRAKLEAEGLFAAGRKRPIPRYPQTIFIVTSREGAALQDMLKVLRRFPGLRLRLYPVPVQGEGAADKIAAAIRHLSEQGAAPDSEVLLLARGGGSLEDLWAFNEEAVARAIAACRIPVVTGIGHEVDVSIADLVADHHAHTPTEAAQVATAQWRAAADAVDASAQRLRRAIRLALADARQRLELVERHEVFRRPLERLNRTRQYLDDRQRALEMSVRQQVRQASRTAELQAARFDRLFPAMMRSLRDRLTLAERRLNAVAGRSLRARAEQLAAIGNRLSALHPRHVLQLHRQTLETHAQRLPQALRRWLIRREEQLTSVAKRLHALSPEQVLGRGYTITTSKRDGKIVRSASQVRIGDRLITRLADGTIQSTAEDAAQFVLFES